MSGEQYFIYQKKEDGICIKRCYAKTSHVIIPAQIDGLPVTEIASYAFAIDIEEEPANVRKLPCICGDLLEELTLPHTIRRLGRYVFYNCFSFQKMSFFTNIAYMGAGTFTGCKKLCKLEAFSVMGEKSCIREILTDLNQTVIVNFTGVKEYSLLYPEFFEEAVENTPARIIETHTHGIGIQYRNTFVKTQIHFKEYDRLFSVGQHNMEQKDALKLTIFRLMSQIELEESAKKEYEEFLRKYIKEAGVLLIAGEELEILYWLAEQFVVEQKELEILIEAAADKPQLLNGLLDVLYRRFPKKSKGFSL